MNTHGFLFVCVMSSAVAWEYVMNKLRLPPIGIINRVALMAVWFLAYSTMSGV